MRTGVEDGAPVRFVLGFPPIELLPASDVSRIEAGWRSTGKCSGRGRPHPRQVRTLSGGRDGPHMAQTL